MNGGERLAPLRVALVGTGQFAREAHIPAWLANEEADLTWVVDRCEEAARNTAEEWEIPNWATDYQDLLSSGEIDAVDICLPTEAHAAATIAFLEADCHVLVEKPVALTVEEGRDMQRAAQESGKTLMVADNWPFSAAMRQLDEVMSSHQPWKPIMLQASHESALRLPPQGPRVRDAGDGQKQHELPGYLFNAGIHTLNLARELVGEFDAIAAFATPTEPGPYLPLDDDVAVAARFENGAVGSFDFTGRSKHMGERRLSFRLIAVQGVIEFDVYSGWVQLTVDGSRTTYEIHAPASGFANPALGYTEEVAHFLECIAEGKEPRTSVDDQLRTLAAVLAAYRSLQTGDVIAPAKLLSEGQ